MNLGLSSPRAGPKGLRAESARAFTDVNFKSSNKYLQIFQQLKVPTDIYKSSNNKTVPTEIYKSSNKYLQIFQQLKVPTDIYKSSNKYLQIFQQLKVRSHKNRSILPQYNIPKKRDSFCQLLTTFTNFWQQLLPTFDNFWPLLTTHGNLWQILVTGGGFWQLLTAYGNAPMLQFFTYSSFRDASLFHFGWHFGKFPKGGRGPFPIQKQLN